MPEKYGHKIENKKFQACSGRISKLADKSN